MDWYLVCEKVEIYECNTNEQKKQRNGIKLNEMKTT
jgi:hypothetical protein